MDYKFLAAEIGKIMRDQRDVLLRHHGRVRFTDKSDGLQVFTDHLTEIDIRVEKNIKEALSQAFPKIGFVGEELGGEASDCYFLVDPIDGTRGYVKGFDFTCSMLALVEEGKPTLGVVYDFLKDDLYIGYGTTAICNGVEIKSSRHTELKDSLLSLEVSSSEYGDVNRRLYAAGAADIKLLSSGIEGIMVAKGQLQAKLFLKPWAQFHDIAPLVPIVNGAGGCVLSRSMQPYSVRDVEFIISCNKEYAQKIWQYINSDNIREQG